MEDAATLAAATNMFMIDLLLKVFWLVPSKEVAWSGTGSPSDAVGSNAANRLPGITRDKDN
ncbi:hypothetical protein [uncultured Bradyrhizobium sp.]|jgi:hypothetical protein|uniref:hypothetical protein n=1 Tax=uncultured Bradyrhizobium sp. TaxID=199684 RepID=UPI00260B577E|nr:hypothetical protein [uncultured Bradyrhizobium sp.]